ncbi:hypothetical protein LWI29_027051 [Acer saccharum]|uniref:Uncharacterized protein n=1 Tax=Acer saccharum TaxID=4024 RepID=A0AA39W0K7_ACESA|nr:hypothetical protein LWI29_027051 [Acer saccharum]
MRRLVTVPRGPLFLISLVSVKKLLREVPLRIRGVKVTNSAICSESAKELDASTLARPEYDVPLRDAGERDDTAPANALCPKPVDMSSLTSVGNFVPSSSVGPSSPSTLAVYPEGVREEPPAAPAALVRRLEHVLIQCLIEFRSFRLLIHKVSSPNVLTMPLYVLLRCVDFIDDFRDDFSTVFQSCIVVFVCERVTVRNPKTDSNSEFGRSSYGPTNRECAGEDSPGRGPHGLAVVEAVGPTAWSPFCSRVGHAPPTAWG